MATLALKALPSEKTAIQRMARPHTITIKPAVLSQCTPPNMLGGFAPLIHSQAVMEETMTNQRISIEPRSDTFPPLPLCVRVRTAIRISEVVQERAEEH